MNTVQKCIHDFIDLKSSFYRIEILDNCQKNGIKSINISIIKIIFLLLINFCLKK